MSSKILCQHLKGSAAVEYSHEELIKRHQEFYSYCTILVFRSEVKMANPIKVNLTGYYLVHLDMSKK